MNKAILMGRLVRDPELRTTQSNVAVCTFTVAVDRRFKNTNGERQADFIPIVAWRQQAEFVGRYFKQGSRIALVGSIQTRTWDDTEGKRHYVTEVIADEVYFADSKRDAVGSDTYESAPAPSAYNRSTPAAANSEKPAGETKADKSGKPYENTSGNNFNDFMTDDDTTLPFDI